MMTRRQGQASSVLRGTTVPSDARKCYTRVMTFTGDAAHK